MLSCYQSFEVNVTMGKSNYIVVQEFTINNGQRTIPAGSVLSLTPEKALPLLERELIEPQAGESLDFDTGFLSGRYIVTIKTELGRLIDLAGHPNALASASLGRALFLADEMEVLSGKPQEMLERIIDTKELFPGCQIEREGTSTP
jgi:hypothetical protein